MLTAAELVATARGQVENLTPRAAFAAFQRRAAREDPGLGGYLTAMLTISQLQAGRPDEAASELDRLAADAFETIPRNFLWTVTMAMLCEAAEMTGNATAGEQLLAALQPHYGRLVANTILVFEPIDLALAQAALATGDLDAAETFATQAAEASRRRRTHPPSLVASSSALQPHAARPELTMARSPPLSPRPWTSPTEPGPP